MEKFKKPTLFLFFVLIVLLGVVLINKYIFVTGIIEGIENYIFRCGDYGQYVAETYEYMIENVFLIDIMEAGKEPLLFLIISSLTRITGLNGQEGYLISFFLLKLIILSGVLVINMRISKAKWFSLAVTLILATSIIDSKAGYVRQTLGNMYMVLCVFSFFLIKRANNKHLLIQSIILSCALISHKIAFLYSVSGLIGILLIELYQKKYKNVLYIFKLITIAVIAGLPYLSLFIHNFYDFMGEYILRYWKNISKTQEFVNQGSLNLSLGTSVIPGNNSIPLLNLIQYQPVLIILFISIARKAFSLKSERQYFFLMIMGLSIIHISLEIAFANRAILLTNIFLIMGLIFCNTGKRIKILILNGVIILNIIFSLNTSLLGNGMLKNYKYNIANDSATKYIKDKLNKENSFFITDHCGSEYIAQIGFKSYLNISKLTIYNQKKQELDGEATFEDWSGRVNILARSIFTQKFAPEELKGKKLYVIYSNFFGSDNQKEIKKINSGDPKFFNQKHVNLIYKNLDNRSYVNYIFEIDTQQLIYFDNINYLDRTLGK